MKQVMSKKISWNEWKGTTSMYTKNRNKHNSGQKQWKNSEKSSETKINLIGRRGNIKWCEIKTGVKI
jgi:hypothetical protein